MPFWPLFNIASRQSYSVSSLKSASSLLYIITASYQSISVGSQTSPLPLFYINVASAMLQPLVVRITYFPTAEVQKAGPLVTFEIGVLGN